MSIYIYTGLFFSAGKMSVLSQIVLCLSARWTLVGTPELVCVIIIVILHIKAATSTSLLSLPNVLQCQNGEKI